MSARFYLYLATPAGPKRIECSEAELAWMPLGHVLAVCVVPGVRVQ